MLRKIVRRKKQRAEGSTGRRKRYKKYLLRVAVLLAIAPVIVYFLQHIWAHRSGQKYLHQTADIVCTPVFGWFTREDRLAGGEGPELTDLQPGDILLTLSTHSLGWRHGHAALVIDEDTTLECALLGMDSCYGDTAYWRGLSQYCVLRIKDVTPQQQHQVVEYACKELCGVPYHLTAGFIGPKAPEPDSVYFGLQCSYLVWYAWNHFGYDLDGDGGRLVTCTDILQSDLLEVVQVYGMEFIKIL